MKLDLRLHIPLDRLACHRESELKIVSLAASVAAVLLAFAAPAWPAALQTYGRLPAIDDVDISPDGSMLALSTTNGEAREVVIRKTADDTVVGVMKIGDAKLRRVQWAGSNHVLVTVSTTAAAVGISGSKREYFTAVDFNLAKKRQTRLLAENLDRVGTDRVNKQTRKMNVILGAPTVRMVKGAPTAFVQGLYFPDRVSRVALFAIDLDSGDTKMTAPMTSATDDWAVSADGDPLAQSQYDQKTGQWSLRIHDGGDWKLVDSAVSLSGSTGVAGLGRDGASVLAVRPDVGDKRVLREYRADGTRHDVADPAFESLITDPLTGVLIGGVNLVGDDLNYTFFAPRDQAAWRSVTKAFKDDRLRLASWSADRRKVVVEADSPTQGPAYAMIDLDAKRATWLGPLYVGLDETGVSEVRSVTYKARDGLPITGYLTLPRGKAAKGLPLVVLAHGGPAARDRPGFDWWAQALASRGYAVLQPNFRGSDGFGWGFLSAGFGEWGRRMQTDLSDGVRDLAAQGLIDPRRVCIVGASYGGYAALAGATLDAGVYRCAAAVAGPADLKAFLIWGQGGFADAADSARLRYWSRFMGVDGVRDPDLAAISPARLADRVEIPVLLIHGKDDTVVPYEQSQIMAAALKKAGKPVEFVTLNGEDHWLSRGATRLQMLTAVAAFLEKNNPPD
ncbi:MAG: peptidase prolyl oligopeptidase active site domain protein [Caulobacter sp.]|nr:peptidase prolyl oligopeptidase active site domain protein [Caulobacter sp.]